MDDPELLAELAAIMGQDPPVSSIASRRARLEVQAKAKRHEAMRLKAVNKTAAINALREAKVLEAEIQAMSSLATMAGISTDGESERPATAGCSELHLDREER